MPPRVPQVASLLVFSVLAQPELGRLRGELCGPRTSAVHGRVRAGEEREELVAQRLFSMRHHLLVRRLHGGAASPWCFAVRAIPGSCAMVWLAVEHRVPGVLGCYYLSALKGSCLDCLVPVFDHTFWQAMPFTWKSPLGQVASFPQVPINDWGDWSIRLSRRLSRRLF